MKLKAQEYVVLEPGTYRATVTGMEKTQAKFGEVVRVKFDVHCDNGKTVPVSELCAAKLTPSCKLRKLVEGLLARRLGADEELDLDCLAGVHCHVKLATKSTDKGDWNTVLAAHRREPDAEDDIPF